MNTNTRYDGAEHLEARAVLRERNQLTLPERIADRLGLRPGSTLVFAIGEASGDLATVRAVRQSWAGIARGAYGDDPDRYLREERSAWQETDASADKASDGTPYLTFEESVRAHPETEVTRSRYEREPWLRWRRCAVCGRRLARMNEHDVKHRDGLIGAKGERTDATQRQRSRERVAKYVATRARKRKSAGRR
ncbi:MAG: hypothetical protein HY071_07045 [Chloroflexi bacterium]|nr:hypothetical protein [Chloroflexota bacterium]